MLQKKSKFSLTIPVSLKVSLWYSTFITLLLALIVGAAFFTMDELSDNVSKQSLVDEVNKKSHSNLNDRFENFDDGVYYSIYDEDYRMVAGMVPEGFRGGTVSLSQVSELSVGERTFYYYDIQLGGEDEYFLRGVTEVSAIKNVLYLFPILILIMSPFILFVVVFVGYSILKKALTPIRDMTNTADEISKSSDLSKRINIPNSKDEVEVLARTFNNMLVSLENSSEREKRFASDVSHELRTPVSVIMAEAEYANKYAENLEESKQSLAVIERQSKRMTDMINQILEISRLDNMDTIEAENVDLSQMLTNISKDYASLIEKNELVLETVISENILFKANHDLMHRLIDNILLNAIKFADKNIKIKLNQQANDIEILIEDDGPGITDANKEKVWDRFYKVDQSRTRTENQSSGLGLSISKKIVELHKGTIRIKDNSPKGTIIEIKFQIKE